METPVRVQVRLALSLIVLLDLTMVSLSPAYYRPLVAMPGGPTFVIKPALLLLLYAAGLVWATSPTNSFCRPMLRFGTPPGFVGGLVQIVHLLLEDLVDFGAWNGAVTLIAMSITFLLWGVAGYRTARASTGGWPGALAGMWSAAVTMLLAVAVGFALLYAPLARLDVIATWPEFRRSGWADVRAFSMANTLDAGFSHLLIGPAVGALFGGVASILAQYARHGKAGVM